MPLIRLRAPGPDEPETAFLLSQLRQSQETLDRATEEARALPLSDLTRNAKLQRYNRLRTQVNKSYRKLDLAARGWAESKVPELYARGHLIATAQLGGEVGFDVLHSDAIAHISRDAYDDVATGLQQVPAQFSSRIDAARNLEQMSSSRRDLLRIGARGAIAQQLILGEESPAEVARKLAGELWANDIQIIDRAGRHWQPESYTRMLVRTKSANAFNAGSLNKYAQEGVNKVVVFDGTEDDAACAKANGQTWTIKYAYEHVIEHPNCRRAFAAQLGRRRPNRLTHEEMAKYVGRRVGMLALERLALREFRRWGTVGRIDLLPPEIRGILVGPEFAQRFVDDVDRLSAWLTIQLGDGVEGLNLPKLPAYFTASRRVATEVSIARRALLAAEELEPPPPPLPHSPQGFRDAMRDVRKTLKESLTTRPTDKTADAVLFHIDALIDQGEAYAEEVAALRALRQAVSNREELDWEIVLIANRWDELAEVVQEYVAESVIAIRSVHDLVAVLGNLVTTQFNGGVNGMVAVIRNSIFVKRVHGLGVGMEESVTHEAIGSLIARRIGLPERDIMVQAISEDVIAMSYLRGYRNLDHASLSGDDGLALIAARNPEDLAVLRLLTGNRDVHTGNMMTDLKNPRSPVVPIDLEAAFRHGDGLDYFALTPTQHVFEPGMIKAVDDYAIRNINAPGSEMMPAVHNRGRIAFGEALAVRFNTVHAFPRVVVEKAQTRAFIEELLTNPATIARELETDLVQAMSPVYVRVNGKSVQEWAKETAEEYVSMMQARTQKAVRWGIIDIYGERSFKEFAGDSYGPGDLVSFQAARRFEDLGGKQLVDGDSVEGIVYSTLRDPERGGERFMLVLDGVRYNEEGTHLVVQGAMTPRVVVVRESAVRVQRAVDPVDLVDELDPERLRNLLKPYKGDSPWHAREVVRLSEDGRLVTELDEVRIETYSGSSKHWAGNVRMRPDVREVLLPEMDRIMVDAVEEVLEEIHPRFRPTAVEIGELRIGDRQLLGVYNPSGSTMRRMFGDVDDIVDSPGGIRLNPAQILEAELEDLLEFIAAQDFLEIDDVLQEFRSFHAAMVTKRVQATLRHEIGHRVTDVAYQSMEDHLRLRLARRLVDDDDALVSMFGEDFLAMRSNTRQGQFERFLEKTSRNVSSRVEELFLINRETVDQFWRSLPDIEVAAQVPESLQYPYMAWRLNRSGPRRYIDDLEMQAEVVRAAMFETGRSPKPVRNFLGEWEKHLLPPFPERTQLLDRMVDKAISGRRIRDGSDELLGRDGRLLLAKPADLPEERYRRVAKLRYSVPGAINEDRVLREIYEHDFGRFRSQTVSISGVGTDSVHVEGKLLLPGGEVIGAFRRHIYKGDDDTWRVYHASLYIDDAHQGKGYGTEFFEWTEDWYIAKGIDRLEVSTASVGGYNWARRGYDFATPSQQLSHMLDPIEIRNTLERLVNLGGDIVEQSVHLRRWLIDPLEGMIPDVARKMNLPESQANHIIEAIVQGKRTELIDDILEASALDPSKFQWRAYGHYESVTPLVIGEDIFDDVFNALRLGVVPYHPDDTGLFGRWVVDLVSEIGSGPLPKDIALDVMIGMRKGGRPDVAFAALYNQLVRSVRFNDAMERVVRNALDEGWTAFDVSQLGSTRAITKVDADWRKMDFAEIVDAVEFDDIATWTDDGRELIVRIVPQNIDWSQSGLLPTIRPGTPVVGRVNMEEFMDAIDRLIDAREEDFIPFSLKEARKEGFDTYLSELEYILSTRYLEPVQINVIGGDTFYLLDWESATWEVGFNATTRGTTWFGKELMLGKGWRGVKKLQERYAATTQVMLERLVKQDMEEINALVRQADGSYRLNLRDEPSVDRWGYFDRTARALDNEAAAAIEMYTFEDYQVINSMLRGRTPTFEEGIELVTRMDRGLRDLPPLDDLRRAFDTDVVFRGDTPRDLTFWEGMLGQTFESESYMSTSFGSEIRGFLWEDRTPVIVVRLHDNSLGRYINPDQDEVVFPRGSRFYVQAITEVDDDGRKVPAVILQDLGEARPAPLRSNVAWETTTLERAHSAASREVQYPLVRITTDDGKVHTGGLDWSPGYVEPGGTEMPSTWIAIRGGWQDEVVEFPASTVTKVELGRVTETTRTRVPDPVTITQQSWYERSRVAREVRDLLKKDDVDQVLVTVITERGDPVNVYVEAYTPIGGRPAFRAADGRLWELDDMQSVTFVATARVDKAPPPGPSNMNQVLHMFGPGMRVSDAMIRNFAENWDKQIQQFGRRKADIVDQLDDRFGLSAIEFQQFELLQRGVDLLVEGGYLGNASVGDMIISTYDNLRAGGRRYLDEDLALRLLGDSKKFERQLEAALEAAYREGRGGEVLDVRFWVFREFGDDADKVERLYIDWLNSAGHTDSDRYGVLLAFLEEIDDTIAGGGGRTLLASQNIEDISVAQDLAGTLVRTSDLTETQAVNAAAALARKAERDLGEGWDVLMVRGQLMIIGDDPDELFELKLHGTQLRIVDANIPNSVRREVSRWSTANRLPGGGHAIDDNLPIVAKFEWQPISLDDAQAVLMEGGVTLSQANWAIDTMVDDFNGLFEKWELFTYRGNLYVMDYVDGEPLEPHRVVYDADARVMSLRDADDDEISGTEIWRAFNRWLRSR